ncbi:MAG: aminotransferase class V-fold PLP-dependent enzyme, partial [Myxococcales bacterium]|nr:aminotransferase class V-fold PLP-dependent enzyme [Myxococcales bacterium]
SVMHANNEVGTLQPVAAIAELAHAAGALLHCDAAQSVGKIAVHPAELGADLLSLAGHKLYAPKGIGVLYVRPGLELEPLIHGGGHERGRRAGTENVLFAVALGAAAAVAVDAPCVDHLAAMRDRLHRGLAAHFGDRLLLNGHPAERLPNTLNLSFLGRRGHDVLARVPDLAASTGSACHSGEVSLSPVLVAMGKSEEACLGAVRFSTGRPTTAAEIDEAVEQLIRTS